MSIVGNIYKRNIYGVMGTLVFHILLISAFLLADVDMKGNVKKDEIIIEFPDLIPELEELTEQQVEEKEDQDNPETNNLEKIVQSNAASNQLAAQKTTSSAEEFFDNEYQKEIDAARQLVSDVTNQLSKEIIDINDIKMPVETTEGMERDSIKNIIYAGESNIVYYLENRYHISLPIPVYLSQGGGKVVVDIVVNRRGQVLAATTRKNRNVKDEQVFLYAKAAALRTVFNADETAPEFQKGTIHYSFIAQ